MSLPTISEDFIQTNWIGFQVYAFARDIPIPTELHDRIEDKLRIVPDDLNISSPREQEAEAEPKSVLRFWLFFFCFTFFFRSLPPHFFAVF
jgi:hypothetical protein